MKRRFKFARQNIFLTGATGVLGARLLKDLLAESDSTIFCLVRGATLEEGQDRLRSFLKTYDPEETLQVEFNKRVHVVLGDVTLPRFGLTQDAYDLLQNQVDSTVHAAACTNLFLTLRRIEPINVGGVKNMLAFVLGTAKKRLCYVSTFTVLGDKIFDTSVTFKETDRDIGQGFEYMEYQRTKFIGEKLIQDAQAEGLVWTIARPGQIFGESETGNYPKGQTNVSGLFLDIFKTVIETQVAFKSKTHFDVTPVDFVSLALIYLVFERAVPYETYHLMNEDIKTYGQVVDLIASMGYPVERVSQEEYKRRLGGRLLQFRGEEYRSATTKAFKWWLNRETFDFTRSAITDSTFTNGILAEGGLICPKLDQKLMKTYIDAGIRQGYFLEPSAITASSEEIALGAAYSTVGAV